MTVAKQLLLISCSATKRHDPGLLPAIQRYHGVVYRLLHNHRPANLSVWIVSAAFGLIAETHLISEYDRVMSLTRAKELAPTVSGELDRVLQMEQFTAVFVNLGRTYAHTVQRSVLLRKMCATGVVEVASGGIGVRLGQTKRWLLAQHIGGIEKQEEHHYSLERFDTP